MSQNTMTDAEVKELLMEVDWENMDGATLGEYLIAESKGYGLKEALDAMPRTAQATEEQPA